MPTTKKAPSLVLPVPAKCLPRSGRGGGGDVVSAAGVGVGRNQRLGPGRLLLLEAEHALVQLAQLQACRHSSREVVCGATPDAKLSQRLRFADCLYGVMIQVGLHAAPGRRCRRSCWGC